MSKRAILYARVSGDDRKYATSGIDSQLTDCRRYAEGKGYEVKGEYFEAPDKQTSGADWLPELNKVLKLAHQRSFDVLIVREIDRLARNRFKQMSVENSLEAAGVVVEYAKGSYEDTAEGRLLKGLVGEFAEYEREKIRGRTIHGIERSVEKGNIKTGGCSTAYGYDIGQVNGRRTLVINIYEAEIVRLIFRLYVYERYSLARIADYLDDHNIPKPLKGAAHKANVLTGRNLGWSAGTLSGILGNEAYIGRWYYRKHKTIKHPKTGKRQHLPRPREEWIVVEVPPIIDPATFEAVKQRRERNKRELGKTRRFTYVLGGMITCGHCGANVSGWTHVEKYGTYSYYRCNRRAAKKRFRGTCALSFFPVKDVETAAWRWVKGILLEPERLAQAFADYQESTQETHAPTLRMIDANEGRAARLEQERERLKAAYRGGVIELEEFAQDRAAMDKEIANLRQAVQQLREELRPQMLTQEDIATIEEFAAVIREGADLTDGDPELQRKIYQKLNMQVSLLEQAGEKWADLVCILGHTRSVANYETSSYTGGCYRITARVPLKQTWGDDSIITAFFASVAQPVGVEG